MTPFEAAMSDLELLSLAQSGNREAFAVLYGRYWLRAVRMATVVCTSSKTARDVVRISFAEAWRNCGEYQPANGSVHSWLFGIVRDQAAFSRSGDDLWGRERYHPKGSSHALDDAMIEPDDVGAEAADAIALLLADAPSDQREVVAMAFFGELSPKEIAHHLGLSEEVVAGRMRFGFEELRSRQFKQHA